MLRIDDIPQQVADDIHASRRDLLRYPLHSPQFCGIIKPRKAVIILKRSKSKKQMRSGFLSLLILSFLVLFIVFVSANVLAVIINCLFNGFENFISILHDLPYLLYLLFSLVLSMVFVLITIRKTKP